ncbi:hypothetical protein F183_A21180 [Bryobacterales bacterium F-183]|nr:hypothetical protein F183_A21180 [Bryobacterales bacterium F-183]
MVHNSVKKIGDNLTLGGDLECSVFANSLHRRSGGAQTLSSFNDELRRAEVSCQAVCRIRTDMKSELSEQVGRGSGESVNRLVWIAHAKEFRALKCADGLKQMDLAC